jgi:uncharacterized delta-60 repeat protein
MNSLIRFRTGITLSIVAAATLVGCGDDDSAPQIVGSDAGDAGVVDISGETQPPAETTTDVNPTQGNGDTSSDSEPTDVSLIDGGTSDVVDASASGETSSEVTGPVVETDASVSTGGEASTLVTEATTSEDTSVAPVDTSVAPVDTSVAPSETSAPEESTVAETSSDVDAGVVDTTDGEQTSVGPVTDEVTSETVDVTSTSDDSTVTPPAPDWIGLEVGDATATSVSVEPQGNDGYLGVVYDADGNFYAVGAATEAGGDSYMSVTKFFGNGSVDSNFGQNGVARKNVSVGGTESVRAIALQTVGATTYIVIAGTAQFDPNAPGLEKAEQDVAVVRFTLGGIVDSAFGVSGVVRLNLNTGIEGLDRNSNPAWVSNDAVWSLGTFEDKLVIHGDQRTELLTTLGDGGTAPRSDLDWVLVRLLADGTLDSGFGDGGKVTLDMLGAGASARAATVLEDGSIIGSGYLTSDVLGATTQQPVLYKVNAAGEFDASFATEDAWGADGVFHDYVVPTDKRAEAYGAAVQGTHLVTMGYGPTNGNGTGTDFIALRFTAEGVHDTTFGTNGATYIDAAGQSDNGRSLVILPDHTILGIGGGRRLPDGEVTAVSDGMLALLTPDGAPIQSFGTNGLRLYELGGSNDFFWAGAVSPDQQSVVVVGIKGATGTGDDADTDGSVLVLPLSHFSN